MEIKQINILWDHSHIWGLLAWKGLTSLGFNCRLLKANEITQASVLGKSNDALLVPGGTARYKAKALGEEGLKAIRRWIYGGGQYIGFCGGAGLGLTQNNRESLGLCPWSRAAFPERIFHMLSGYVWAKSETGERLKLPVWWPGRFDRRSEAGIRIIARYFEPDEELLLDDRPINGLTSEQYFPFGEPVIISGNFGKGTYMLSYAHLETPESPDANLLLMRALGRTGQHTASAWQQPQ